MNSLLGEENWFWIRFAVLAILVFGLGLIGEFG